MRWLCSLTNKYGHIVEVKVTLQLMVSHSVYLGVESTLGLVTRYYFLSGSCSLVSIGRLLWPDDRSEVCSAITQCSESRRTHNHTSLSHLRLPQPAEQGPLIYIPQEQGGQVIFLGTVFPLHCLLRLAGLWWRYGEVASTTNTHPIEFDEDAWRWSVETIPHFYCAGLKLLHIDFTHLTILRRLIKITYLLILSSSRKFLCHTVCCKHNMF
jgi:hypothetical protein